MLYKANKSVYDAARPPEAGGLSASSLREAAANQAIFDERPTRRTNVAQGFFRWVRAQEG